ncbi:MAG: hypothetical protein ACRD8W_23160 [Nitrososphaeraceae archaeon]
MLESKDPSYLSMEVNNQTQHIQKQNNDELKHTLKMRLVKGEISKEEYLEILKMIES